METEEYYPREEQIEELKGYIDEFLSDITEAYPLRLCTKPPPPLPTPTPTHETAEDGGKRGLNLKLEDAR